MGMADNAPEDWGSFLSVPAGETDWKALSAISWNWGQMPDREQRCIDAETVMAAVSRPWLGMDMRV